MGNTRPAFAWLLAGAIVLAAMPPHLAATPAATHAGVPCAQAVDGEHRDAHGGHAHDHGGAPACSQDCAAGSCCHVCTVTGPGAVTAGAGGAAVLSGGARITSRVTGLVPQRGPDAPYRPPRA